jgi:hypothetical protein
MTSGGSICFIEQSKGSFQHSAVGNQLKHLLSVY